eukprot:1161592-Pelagomonas_calceolata.AAC.9
MGCSSCGQPCMQTLKNLVLGGIASFTVVDDARCSAIDLGNNFMVGPSSLGEPRAKPCTTFCSTAECKGWAAKVRGIVVQGCMALRQACAFVRFMEPALTLVGCAGELNESVAGSYIEESPENLINSNPQFFHQFTVVVATQVGLGLGYLLQLSVQILFCTVFWRALAVPCVGREFCLD